MSIYPSEFLKANDQRSKSINVVLEIDGLDFAFGLSKTFKKLTYGTPGITYGSPGLVYGGLLEEDKVRPYLSLDSSLILQQRIEPEQGRASTATLTLVLIDKNQEVSQVISSGGGLLDEILGRSVLIRAGFVNTSYPGDYFVVFRGTISNVLVQQGRISITVTDGNQRRRQAIFQAAKTKLSAAINSAVTSIPVLSSDGFPVQILGPLGTYDSGVKTYIKVDDEFMEYGPTGVAPTQFTVTRGARGSTAAAHDIDADVSNVMELQGNAIDLALKLMLSGWNGPFLTDVAPQAIATKIDPAFPLTPRAIVLPEGKNADVDYGLVAGDFVTISGSAVGNDGQYQIVSIDSNNLGTDNVLIVDQDLNYELASSTLRVSFRSQFDVLPVAAGIKLDPKNVDVRNHLDLRDVYFFDASFTLRFLIQEQVNGKEFIERELYYPLSAYGLTRFGRLSLGVTKPPLPPQTLQFINVDNVIDPENITITRGLNNRRFFNQVQFEYDPTDAGAYQYIVRAINVESIDSIGEMRLLPIKAAGVRDDLNGASLATKTTQRLLTRYAKAAYELRLTVNFQTGIQIEAGDIVAIQDNGQLQILNFSTGSRSLGISLFEVIDRTLDLKTGRVSLVLLSNVGSGFEDRFGTIAPSSRLTGASTASALVIQDSYGAVFPGAEFDKWVDYVGFPILVHRGDYSVSAETVLSGFDPGNPYRLIVSPALPFTPLADDIVEIANYPTSDDPGVNAIYKSLHAFLSVTAIVSGGTSTTEFTVAGTYLQRFIVGRPIRVHSEDYVRDSGEVIVAGVNLISQTVTVETSLGFVPVAGDLIELGAFPDGGYAYRFV